MEKRGEKTIKLALPAFYIFIGSILGATIYATPKANITELLKVLSEGFSYVVQVIAPLSGIATVLAAFATYLTVKEMARAREQSIKPELVFSDKYYNCVGGITDTFHEGIEFYSHNEDHQFPKGNDFEKIHDIFSITNVGYGPAVDVVVTWNIRHYDNKRILEILRMFPDVSVKKNYGYQEYEMSFLSHGNDETKYFTSPLPSSSPIDYHIKTSIAQGESAEFRIPSDICSVIFMLILFNGLNNTETKLNVSIEVSYKTIGYSKMNKNTYILSIVGSLSIANGHGVILGPNLYFGERPASGYKFLDITDPTIVNGKYEIHDWSNLIVEFHASIKRLDSSS